MVGLTNPTEKLGLTAPNARVGCAVLVRPASPMHGTGGRYEVRKLEVRTIASFHPRLGSR